MVCLVNETMKPGFLDHPHGFGDTRTQRRDGRLGSAPKGVQVEPSNIWGTSESRSNRPRRGPPAGWGRPRTIITTNDNDNINDSSPFPVPSSISSESSLTGTSLALTTIATTTSTSTNTTLSSTSRTSHHPENPFAGQPWLPVKTMGVPKAALNDWYMQKPRSWQCSNDQYITWSDGGMPHQMKFTCAFVCPLSGEVFLSGEYGNAKHYTVQHDAVHGIKMVWYSECIVSRCVYLSSIYHQSIIYLTIDMCIYLLWISLTTTRFVRFSSQKDGSPAWSCLSGVRLHVIPSCLWYRVTIGSFGS